MIEIVSLPTGLNNDNNLIAPSAKPQLYDRIGVEEYLVFDSTGGILGSPGWARRRGPDGMTTWTPEADGRWHSTLGISFMPQGMLLRVYDHEGHLVPLITEYDALHAARNQRLAENNLRVAALEAEVRRLRRE